MEISLLVLREHITLFVYKVLVSVSLTGLYPLTSLPPYPKECLSTLQAFISCKRKGTNTTLLRFNVVILQFAFGNILAPLGNHMLNKRQLLDAFTLFPAFEVGKRWRWRKYKSLRHFTMLLFRCWVLLVPSNYYNISNDGSVKKVNCQSLRRKLCIIFLTHKIGHVLSQVFAVEFYQLVTGEDICQSKKFKSSVS